MSFETVTIGNATLIRGDCMEVLPTLGRFDAVITDPPYLTTDLHFDKSGLDMKWVDQVVHAVNKNGYMAVFCPVEMSAEIAKKWSLRWTGFWLKPAGAMRTHNAKKPPSSAELYTVFAHPDHKIKDLYFSSLFLEAEPYQKKQRNTGFKRDGKDQISRANSSGWTKDGFVSNNFGTRVQSDVIAGKGKQHMQHADRTEHPTQKPVEVMATLIGWTVMENGLVLDPFMGSGTTGVAAIQLGRTFTGIERDPKYFDIACERIERACAQGQLFDPVQPKQEQMSLEAS